MKATLLIPLVVLSTCFPRAEPAATGLHVGYSVGDRVMQPGPGDVAIATHGRAQLEVFVPRRLEGGAAWIDRSELDPVSIQSAVSEDEEVAAVLSLGGSHLLVEGRSRGTTHLILHTERGMWKLGVSVAEPARVELGYEPRDGAVRDPIFLVGGTARFRMVRRDSAGHLLGGRGDVLPVRVDPPGAAYVSTREGDTERADVRFDRPGRITLRPLGGAPVRAEAVEVSDREVTIEVSLLDEDRRASRPVAPVALGRSPLLLLTLRRDDGRRLFGLIGRASLTSTTERLCEVANAEQWHADGVYQLRPLGEGTCILEAFFDDLSTTVEVPIIAGDAAADAPAAAGGSPEGTTEASPGGSSSPADDQGGDVVVGEERPRLR